MPPLHSNSISNFICVYIGTLEGYYNDTLPGCPPACWLTTYIVIVIVYLGTYTYFLTLR